MTDLPAAETSTSNLKGIVETIEPNRNEQTLARRAAEARAVVPTAELSAHVAIDAELARAATTDELVALVISHTARALRAVPRVNGSYRDARYDLYGRVNVGVVLVEEGVHMTPTLLDADQKSATELEAELTELYTRARAGELHPSALAGATFTVIDATAYGVASLTPLITPPQAGTLAIGPLRAAPIVRDGALVAGHTLTLTLAVDQRIVHGWHAMEFLDAIKESLEEAA